MFLNIEFFQVDSSSKDSGNIRLAAVNSFSYHLSLVGENLGNSRVRINQLKKVSYLRLFTRFNNLPHL